MIDFITETIGKDAKERTLRCENVCYEGNCGQMGGKSWGKKVLMQRKKKEEKKLKKWENDTIQCYIEKKRKML